MTKYKISEIAKLTNVTVKAIRIYEEKNLISSSRDEESNYRNFSKEVVESVHTIKLLQNLGLTLNEISLIFNSRKDSDLLLKDLLKKQLVETSNQINTLSERKKILTNIIEKYSNVKDNLICQLTAREREVFMGITTGFSKLDKLLASNDLEKISQVLVIAAHAGMGKTALTIHIAYNLLEQTNKPICFFSTEYDHREWAKRIAIQKCEDDQGKIEDVVEEIKNKPIYYRHNKEISMDEIFSKVSELNTNLGAIVIDYFQDIRGDGTYKAKMIKELSTVARCPVLVISTVNKKSAARPMAEDLVDHKVLREIYDKLLIVSRSGEVVLTDNKKIAHIDVYDSFGEESSSVHLVWDGSYCSYSDQL